MTSPSPDPASVSSDHLDSLNPEQREAVEHFEGPALVLAGAGSGKTRVLTTRIVHLVHEHGVPPDRILAVTFTNKAAGEMRERIQRMLGGEPRGMWAGTFHALGARILRRHAQLLGWTNTFTIFDAEQSLRQIKRSQEGVGIDPKRWSPKAMRGQISGAKNQLVSPKQFVQDNEGSFDIFVRNVAKVYPTYQNALKDQNAFDFDDLLVKPVELFQSHPAILDQYRNRFSFILVDEYQDTNRAQFRFLQLLAEEHGNLMVVGDDDQCVLPGTAISGPDGDTPVERIRPGHRITAACGSGRTADAPVEHAEARVYRGPVVRIETEDGHGLTATANHMLFGRLRVDEGLWYVYLMEKDGLGFRVGISRGVRARRSGERVLGLQVRLNQERADRAWVLTTARTEEEARLHEGGLSLRYGIPTSLFHGAGRRLALSDESLRRLHEELDTPVRAERLMDELLVFREFPHHVPSAVVRGERVRRHVTFTLFGDGRDYAGRGWSDHRIQLNTSGGALRGSVRGTGFPGRERRRDTWRVETARKDHDDGWAYARRLAATVEGGVRMRARLSADGSFDLMPAAHLHPGMEVPVVEQGAVRPAVVRSRAVEWYEGPVYDLQVENLRNYVAGGLCVHNSIYGWRGADIQNILQFEQTFPGARVVRLERNYRSSEKILSAANHVIAENVHRKGKTLRTDREGGEALTLMETLDENDEARCIVEEVKARYENGPDLHQYRDFAVLYRTNAQSRALEDGFRRRGIPYQIVGGVRFYERREIQDVMGYLRLVSNPRDEDAFQRVVNYPRRGIGGASVERLLTFADERGMGLLEAAEIATESEDIPTGGARSLEAFAKLIQRYSARAATTRVGPLLEDLVDELGLLESLRDEGPDGEDRAENVKELIAGALDFDAEVLEEWETEDLDGFSELDLFLQRVALVADIDRHDPDADTVTLMTLHNAKGLEYPVVFIAGLEDGLFPLSRARDDPSVMEEERRLFYVGITRAEDKLYLTHARQRRRAGEYMYGRLTPFVEAIPPGLIESRPSPLLRRAGDETTPHRSRAGSAFGSGASGGRGTSRKGGGGGGSYEPDYEGVNQDAPRFVKGERVAHGTFGSGSVVEISGFGKDTKVTVDFDDVGRKKLLVRYANLEKDWDL